MATTMSPPATSESPGWIARHQFLIYRLFSLSGLVPIGAYACVHLLTNATILDSPATFQRQVDAIHGLGKALPVVEWLFIFIPLAFHATVGWLIIAGAVPNTSAYPYTGNIRYTLQRGTAILAFFFILAHLVHMHQVIGGPLAQFGGAKFHHEHAASSAGAALQASLGVQIFYALGVLAVAYHLGNGVWTFGITWGLWVSAAAQRRATVLAVLVGVGVAAVGLSALVGMARVDVDAAHRLEERMGVARQLLSGQVDPATLPADKLAPAEKPVPADKPAPAEKPE